MLSLFIDSDEEETPMAGMEHLIFSEERMKQALNGPLQGIVAVSTSAPDDSISLQDAKTCTLTKLPKDVLEVMRESGGLDWEAKLLVAHCLNLTKFPNKNIVAKKILAAKGESEKKCEPGMRILCETWRTEAIEAIKTLESEAEEELVVFELLTAISNFILECDPINSGDRLDRLKDRDIDWESGLSEISAVCAKAVPRQRNALFFSCNGARNRLRQIRVEQKSAARKAPVPVQEEAVAGALTREIIGAALDSFPALHIS